MERLVDPKNTICKLNYLVGTLATAYKGSIKSLVAKDFCMSEDVKETALEGTVLSIPEGDYEASLIQSGVELARAGLRNGSFFLKTSTDRIKEDLNLQIDVIQSGRHIGTFLMKRMKADGSYSSAVELSEELAGKDFTLLTIPLRDKVGLLLKAEEIVSYAHSTKKDWVSFSEKLSGFSQDFYWSSADAFCRAFDIIAHYMLIAAEHISGDNQIKALSNYFDLLDLIIENEHDQKRLATLTEHWVKYLSRSSVNLSLQAHRVAAIQKKIFEKIPDLDLRNLSLKLITSLRNTVPSMIFLKSKVISLLSEVLPANDVEMLARFGEQGYLRMTKNINEAEMQLKRGDTVGAFRLIEGLDLDYLDDNKSASLLFEIVEKDLSPESAGPLIESIELFLSTTANLHGRTAETVCASMPRILERLLILDRTDMCTELLRLINNSDSVLKDRIILSPSLARSILRFGQSNLITLYLDSVRSILIPAARVRGISPDTWAELVNPMHVEQLRRFIELLSVGGDLLESILVHVSANLSIGGVLIPDDRLFQRSVSAYLNSPAMKDNFLLNLLMLMQLPIYFNDVGAVSKIRDYSTEIDSWGNDAIIYFLRKQVHVNASSNNIRLIENIIRSWVMSDPTALKNVVATDIAAKADQGLMKRYAAVINQFFRNSGVLDATGLHLEKILQLADKDIDNNLQTDKGSDDEAIIKVKLLCKLYKEISRKYSLVNRDTVIDDTRAGLLDLVARIKELTQIILSSERTDPHESLYFKRHIAFGIPSVLGTYHERKFDALCDLIRIGRELPVYLEVIIDEVEKKGSAPNSEELHDWVRLLGAAWQALKLYGMQNVLIDEFLMVIEHGELKYAQIVDVLKMWQKELGWLVSSVNRTFYRPLWDIVTKFPKEDLAEHLWVLSTTSPSFTAKAVDAALRDILNSIPGLVESDRLLNAIITGLRSHKEQKNNSPRGETKAWEFYDIHDLSAQDALRLGPRIGNKAKNLILAKEEELNVPAGVVLPADQALTLSCEQDITAYLEYLHKVVKAIETRTGKTFGGTRHPLLISVRSGSYISMPGILNSILYCGINDETLKAYIDDTGNHVLGWDSYRRFIEHYGIFVLGLPREFFESIIKQYMSNHSLYTADLRNKSNLQTIINLYKARLREKDLLVPSDVYEQLLRCIIAVYKSWYSDRASQFRSATNTSEAWGTSVTLMEMIPGNQDGSGASIFFTRDPATGEQSVYGETKENASGDDIVSGRTIGHPLSQGQGARNRDSLEETDPELFRYHQKLARKIEETFGNLPQEVEVTYTRDLNGTPRLFVLQTRRMEETVENIRSFDDICKMKDRVIGKGIGANGGALSGVASFADSPEIIENLKRKSGMPVILIRKTANTEDVSLMPVVKGIITSAGGVTSHGAVLAQNFGLTAVVSCADLKIDVNAQDSPSAFIGSTRIQEGTLLSIDGRTGLVFSGSCAWDHSLM
jgi:pyruvate,orthophosphate dikinase